MKIKDYCNIQLLQISEAAEFLKVSKSQLYKLTSQQEIPFYKPAGKLIYFRKEDLINWVLRNRSIESDFDLLNDKQFQDEI